jgi:hypothetical protein
MYKAEVQWKIPRYTLLNSYAPSYLAFVVMVDGWVLTCNETVRRPVEERVVCVLPNNSDHSIRNVGYTHTKCIAPWRSKPALWQFHRAL